VFLVRFLKIRLLRKGKLIGSRHISPFKPGFSPRRRLYEPEAILKIRLKRFPNIPHQYKDSYPLEGVER